LRPEHDRFNDEWANIGVRDGQVLYRGTHEKVQQCLREGGLMRHTGSTVLLRN
jgi:hypothetical protein